MVKESWVSDLLLYIAHVVSVTSSTDTSYVKLLELHVCTQFVGLDQCGERHAASV